MPRKCENSLDLFCYICGGFTTKGKQRSITSDIKKVYKLYFACPLGDQAKSGYYIRCQRLVLLCICCCCLPDPFRGMGAWRKTIEPQKPGNFPRPGLEVVKRQRVAKERAAQRVRSWTVQNEMRGVLGRLSSGVARRIPDSANPKKITA